MQRRHFVVATTAAVMSAGFAFWFRARGGESRSTHEKVGLARDPKGTLALLPGFSYRIIERVGGTMSDGYRVPARPDAMACFALGKSRWALMRNHELGRGSMAYGPYFQASDVPKEAYDAQYPGGVTRMVLDHKGQRISSNLVLTGTARNCAGGMSPWGFLTCEENVDKGHGYVFLCSIHAESVRQPRRIPAYGRFLHEGVVVDPKTHIAYLTEDRGDSCLYRFVPDNREDPFGAGKLQALAVRGSARFNVSDSITRKKPLPVTWVDVPHEAGERDDSLRHEAQRRGAAIIRRGEGIWFAEDGIFFTSTSGGSEGYGQVLHLSLASLDTSLSSDMLSLIAQPEDEHTLNMPDNLTVTPWGDLMVCEDNQRDAFLRLVTRDGRVLPFAHNLVSSSELAGVCFSPDGRIMFVNIQENGLTLAIEGPWEKLRRA